MIRGAKVGNISEKSGAVAVRSAINLLDEIIM
jgi:hypothetical protein